MSDLIGQVMTPQVKFILFGLGMSILLIYLASIFWVYRDAKLRGARGEFWALISAIPLLGITLYWMLRPAMYEADSREQELEIARRERELYTEGYCKACEYPVEVDYLICPNCKVKLKKECSACKRALKLKWDVCPYCRTNQEEMPRSRADRAEASSSRSPRGADAAAAAAALAPDTTSGASPAEVNPASSNRRSATASPSMRTRSVTRRRKSE